MTELEDVTSTGGFGRHLRALRRQQGLSQAVLGGERYSGSYVSHLESGRRSPTTEVVEYLAAQLGLTPGDLLPGEPPAAPAEVGGTRHTTVLEFNARAAWERREYDETVRLARLARVSARERGEDSVWWSASHLLAQALLVLEEHDACLGVAEELARDPFAQDAGELQVEGEVLASRACRSAGRLEEALTHARRAAATADALPPQAPQRAQALLAELAALGELGRTEDADRVATRLRDLRNRLSTPHLRGLVAWSLGNLAFVEGSVAEGISEHDLAARLLSPESDLRAWGRFCKASVSMRLTAGSTEGAAELLDRATEVIGLVGNEGDRLELDLSRALLLLRQGRPQEALEVLGRVLAVDTALPPHTRAEAEWARHQCLTLLGDREAAREAASAAALKFEEAGAFRRALEMWRAHAGMESAT